MRAELARGGVMESAKIVTKGTSAAALASEAKQFSISVATLKTLYKREGEDGTGGGAAPTCSQHGRAARTNSPYPNHDGTRFLDLSSDED
eukprot:jgi/Tetstr1/447014/TSEL_034472.t1